jgi:serine protease SohB
MVHSYCLASSQLARIKDKGIPLTVCVDKVAASGGYMMACVAQKICAAPFAVIGSIGVVAQLPNFHRLLKKNDVDFEMLTAGEYKRTLTMFGENTDKGRQKFVEELETTHELFKRFVSSQRPVVDIDKVATGEIWFGSQAKEQCLIDELITSDEYIMQQVEQADIYKVEYSIKKTLAERVGLNIQSGIENTMTTLFSKLNASRFIQ